MRGRACVVASALMIALGACTGGGAQSGTDEAPSPAARDLLVLRTSTGALALETGAGTIISQNPGAWAAPDGSRLYVAAIHGNATTISTIDPRTGETIGTSRLNGRYEARAASLSGEAVALTAPRPAGVDEWTPIPRAHTTIAIADPSNSKNVERYRLDGNFEPEAFSIDDSKLFMIEYLPSEAPTAYRVTTLDLADGDVYPVFGRFKTPPERMPGIRLRQSFDPRLDQLYTLYTNRPSAYIKGESGYGGSSSYGDKWATHGDDEVTFVHVLNLREGWAYCAGMPRPLWGQPANAQAIAPSPDGRILYIVDSMKGIVTEMNTRSLKIERTAHIDLGASSGLQTAVVASPDGSRLFVASARNGSTVYTVDTDTLDVTNRWTVAGPVADLQLSTDGARLYAATADQLTVLDTTTGSSLGSLSADGVESILSVATPVAS